MIYGEQMFTGKSPSLDQYIKWLVKSTFSPYKEIVATQPYNIKGVNRYRLLDE